MFGLGYGELIVLLVIVVVLFGAKRIPELAKSLGSSLNAFKSGLKQDDDAKPKT
jgi:sec-independent protein translocase protein TatA